MTKFDNVRFKQFPDYQTNSCGWKPVRYVPKPNPIGSNWGSFTD